MREDEQIRVANPTILRAVSASLARAKAMPLDPQHWTEIARRIVGFTAGWRAKTGRREQELRNSQEKRRTRLHSEKQACPKRRTPTAVKTGSSRRQPERGSKAFWDAKQLDQDLGSCWKPRIASKPLLPGEARVRSLRAGQDHARYGWRSGGGRWLNHLDTLVSHELHAGASVFSPAPILPEQRSRTDP